MEEVLTPASGSPLSEIDSDEVEDVNFIARSRSNSGASTISASSDNSESPSISTPRNFGMPPAKRRKTGASTYDHATPQSASTAIPPRSPSGSISSDTSGSVPTSPSFAHLGPTHPLSTAYAAAQANPENPELADYIQVTRCLWDDCPNPEQGNMDNVVAHINDVHIVPRQKKYYCQWAGCSRKGQPHTSAYALKAHMRSHTKEKPFFCVLPECDRSFTRSDALAKHMRTVHETEALRPSDPVPRGHTGGISNGNATGNGTLKRIKLVMNSGANGDKRNSIIGDLPPLPTIHTLAEQGIKIEDIEMRQPPISAPSGGNPDDETTSDLADAVDIDTVPFTLPVPPEYYPSDIYEGLDEYERNLPPSQLFRLLRRQIQWAKQDAKSLISELESQRTTTEDVNGQMSVIGNGSEEWGTEHRRNEWFDTEQLLDTLMRAEAGRVNELFTGRKMGQKGNDAAGNAWAMLREVEKFRASNFE